jgi:hypothetical protein
MTNETSKLPLNFASNVLTVIPAFVIDGSATFIENVIVLTESGSLYYYMFD